MRFFMEQINIKNFFNAILKFEECVKKRINEINEECASNISFEDSILYCGSTAMNLMLLSQNIKKMGMIPEESEMIEIPDDELYENRLKVRKIHDIDIHVFSSLLFNDIEAEDDVESYPYKIKHDDSCFGEPKYFPNDNRPYIVIDRYKDSALKDGLTCVKPKDYCIVKIDDREYHVETPLNLLANKIAFSLNQADFYSYFARKGNFKIDNNELNNISADILYEKYEKRKNDEYSKGDTRKDGLDVLSGFDDKFNNNISDIKVLYQLSRTMGYSEEIIEGYILEVLTGYKEKLKDNIYYNNILNKLNEKNVHSIKNAEDYILGELKDSYNQSANIREQLRGKLSISSLTEDDKFRITRPEIIGVAKEEGVIGEKENAREARSTLEKEVTIEKQAESERI